MRIHFFIWVLLFLVSCTKKEIRISSDIQSPRFMFQNGVGLNLESAGCSILDLGGAGRMCERVRGENPDLLFQVGPAFSFLIPKDVSYEKQDGLRRALIKVWNAAGVSFYSVDAADLSPGLEAFTRQLKSRSFAFLSTNLRDKSGKSPFQLSHKVFWKNHLFIFLSFSSPQRLSDSKDWQALTFKDALAELGPLLNENPSAQLMILGALGPLQREELSKLLGRPAYFVGGALEEENSTEWSPFGFGAFWGKAVDLGRGMGTIQWNSAPSGELTSQFSSKGLRKDLDAANQCTKIINEVFGSSR